ncbi:MAG: hypothetical protein IKM44_04565 [Clostridia bacterium]|nr:hypothetical protein [Clostridia bacterium]
MNYELHDSQISELKLGENTIILNFSQGYWTTDDSGKELEQMKNCQIVYEIDRDDIPLEDFIYVLIAKKGGAYKKISLKKFIGLLKKSPFDVSLEYNCNFASSKMLRIYSNLLRVSAEIFIEDIKNVEYLHE